MRRMPPDITCTPSRLTRGDEHSVLALRDNVLSKFGRIDGLVNNAVARPMKTPDAPLSDWEESMKTNATGLFAITRAVGDVMAARGAGSIVNIGSIASMTAMGRGHIAYVMAMGAVVQMTRELSTEWSGRGVRVNAILPAQVINESISKRIADDPKLGERFLSGIPRGRLGEPDDIKGLAVLLASDASSWITGALIPMDGGNLAMNPGASIP